jgi:hypothetical protein
MIGDATPFMDAIWIGERWRLLRGASEMAIVTRWLRSFLAYHRYSLRRLRRNERRRVRYTAADFKKDRPGLDCALSPSFRSQALRRSSLEKLF